jgi:hypothetical protein
VAPRGALTIPILIDGGKAALEHLLGRLARLAS